jgi:hypothetical protein
LEEDNNTQSAAQAPLKKKNGPVSIENIGLKYKDKKLSIMFDATFELGPIGFALLGFSVGARWTTLDQIPDLSVNIDGLAAVFDKPPLSIAGIIRHGNTGELDYYAGGLIVGFVPYQFQAAGFYGQATPKGQQPFTSVFVFAKIDGPLVTLEFAEISGITGGFGYNSSVRTPSLAEIPTFPFIASKDLGGATTALKALEKLTDPGPTGWFRPLDNTYWAAAGMKVSAFEMLSIDTVLVVQFGSSIKLGIFALAMGDVPAASAPLKFAHVELGIAVTVDFDLGVFKAEAQLSPRIFVLDPSCHLTGGMALYYWFDAPHADKANVGNFVFTLGGYHAAYIVPLGYPNPPRLGISWSMGSSISISGQAYFAITPNVCMDGGHLRATFSAGPIQAWFDAFADFLINYRPFFFQLQAGISVGIRFKIDFLFIHTSISVEIGAQLCLWGPPVAGRVHVNFWIIGFDINFGDSPTSAAILTLYQFYLLVLQADSSKQLKRASKLKGTRAIEGREAEKVDTTDDPEPPRPKNEGHNFLAQAGLMNTSDDPQTPANSPWTVRGGIFDFIISCKMAINIVKMSADGQPIFTYGEVYSKPMHLTNPMASTLVVEFKQGGVVKNDGWRLSPFIKQLPAGLWDKCKISATLSLSLSLSLSSLSPSPSLRVDNFN